VRRGGDCVVVLDFRPGQGPPVSAAGLREAVAEESRREGRAEPGDLRFLVVDTPGGLTAHAEAYELVMGYPTLGAVHVLCLAVGDLPRDGGPAGGPPRPERRLRVASVLRTSTAGVLWAADPLAGGPAGPDPDTAEARAALGVFVDLLRTPEVFDEVLAALLRCPAAAAAPAVHVLEHDLSAAVRDRAWRDALERFAGSADTPETAPPPRDLPAPLAQLTRTTPEPSAAPLRRPGGAADTHHGACARALDTADAARDELARPTGLLTGRSAARELPRAIGQATHALARYRDLVISALRESGAPGTPPGEAALRLADAGIDPPPPDGPARRGDSTDGLQQYTAHMLAAGLALRTVAGRLSALSQQVAPLPAGGRVPRMERACPAGAPRASTGHPLVLATARPASLAPVAGLALLSALWPWPGTLLALLPLALLLCGWALASAANPGRAAGGQVVRARAAQTAAVVAGAAGGATLAWALKVPAWAGLAGVVFSVVGTAALTGLRWRRAVDAWWDATGAAELHRALAALDTGLAEAVHLQWWAAADRTRCADTARTLAAVLRAAASGPTPTQPAGDPDWPWDPPDPAAPRAWDTPAPPEPTGWTPEDGHQGGAWEDTWPRDPEPAPTEPASAEPGAPDRPDRYPGQAGGPDPVTHAGWDPTGRTAPPGTGPSRPGGVSGPGARPDMVTFPGWEPPGGPPAAPGTEPAGPDEAPSGAGHADWESAGAGTPTRAGAWHTEGDGRWGAAPPDGGPPADGAGTARGDRAYFGVEAVAGVPREWVPDPAGETPAWDGEPVGGGNAGGPEPHGRWHADAGGPWDGTSPEHDEAAPAWLDRGAGDGGPELLATLAADLADATVDALRRHWGERGSGGQGPAVTLEAAVRRGMEAARHHLERNGIVPAPPFARGERHRGDPLALLGIGVHRVREALDPEASGARLVPLCTAGQLALLSRDPTAAQVIRIAPEAVRSALAAPAGSFDDPGHGASGHAVWTASGRFAGAVRLTPLRAGAVETVRIRAWAEEPPTGAPADTTTHAATYADEGARTAPDDRRSGGSTW
jgi:hypothetical protein